MFDHQSAKHLYGIAKTRHILPTFRRLTSCPCSLSAARLSIFIVNDDVESPLGYLLSSLKRKVEIASNHLLKYGGDRCHNMHAVSSFFAQRLVSTSKLYIKMPYSQH